MRKYIKYLIGIPILIICVFLTIVLIKQNKDTTLKVNEIKINGNEIILTADKSDYSEYGDIDEFWVYENKWEFQISIDNPDILTYKNIKVGDNAENLDFCEEKVPNIFLYETDYSSKGYPMEILYGVNPFDNTILSITYTFNKN